MVSLLLKITEQLNSSVFVLIGILILASIILYKVGGWAQRFIHQDSRIDDIKCKADQIIEIRTKVDMIYQNLKPNLAVKGFSPLGLTEIGKEISNKIQANKLYTKYASKLKAEVVLPGAANAYDIQQLSMIAAKEKMVNYLTEQELILVKDEAYLRGLLVEDILAVIGLLLRDDLLQEKGLPMADVDKYDPEKK